MIEKTIANWHAHIRGKFDGGLDALLAEDCTFYSPVVFTPQRGKEITKLYLGAAASTFDGPTGEQSDSSSTDAKPQKENPFRYTKEVLAGNHAFLEFETELEGKYVNGVDIITCNDEGKIVEFKVMVRPLQAINMLHRQMGQMLEKMKG